VFLGLGIVLLALGLAAVGAETVATKAAVTLLGVLMIVGGVSEVAVSLWLLRQGGFVLHLLSGVLSVVLGMFILRHPLAAAAGLTLLLAVGWLISGVFRLAAAVVLQTPNWGFAALSGLATAVLGGMIWAEWPAGTMWVIGMLIGIELIFRGASWISLALMLRSLPEEAAEGAA
jgi:uncharacterized membrane protein HdeD (DUF308 family)